jgi:hypothetical protein
VREISDILKVVIPEDLIGNPGLAGESQILQGSFVGGQLLLEA